MQKLIPAEHWETFAESNSCMKASEQKGNTPISVKTFEHGGFLHTSFATIYGSYGLARKPTVQAYKLLPVQMYEGATTLVYHDHEAINAGLRQRGDLTGLIVSVGGKLVVCAERADFLMEIPGTRALPLVEARIFDENAGASGGWRALWYSGAVPKWFSLQGHPVVVYGSGQRESHAVLFWKSKGGIREMSISEEIDLSPVSESISAPEINGQLCLI